MTSCLLGGALFFQKSQKPSSDTLVNYWLCIRITEEFYKSYMFLKWQSAYLARTKP